MREDRSAGSRGDARIVLEADNDDNVDEIDLGAVPARPKNAVSVFEDRNDVDASVDRHDGRGEKGLFDLALGIHKGQPHKFHDTRRRRPCEERSPSRPFSRRQLGAATLAAMTRRFLLLLSVCPDGVAN